MLDDFLVHAIDTSQAASTGIKRTSDRDNHLVDILNLNLKNFQLNTGCQNRSRVSKPEQNRRRVSKPLDERSTWIPRANTSPEEADLPAVKRLLLFASRAKLKTHFHCKHLRHLPGGQPIACPHSRCDATFNGTMHLQNHIEVVHRTPI
jgi:hypothetical protein